MATLERIVDLRKKSGDKYYVFVEKDARKKISVIRALPFVIGYITLIVIILAPSLLPEKWVALLYGGKPYFDFITFTLVMG